MPDDRADFVSLTNIAGGAVVELFDAELEKVLRNVSDPNTPAEAKRVIQIQVRIAPNAKREVGDVTVAVSSKMPSFQQLETVVYFGRHQGRHVAQESNPKQLSFDDQPTVVGMQGGKL